MRSSLQPATNRTPPRSIVLRFAAEAELDPRTCLRALTLGAGALHSKADQERAVAAAERMGIALPYGGEP